MTTETVEKTENTALVPHISDICDRIIEEKRWRPFKDKNIALVDGQLPFSAYISLPNRRIHINVSPDFESIVTSMLNEEKIGIQIDDAIDAIIYHLFVHEYNHHYYCPHSVFLFQQIIEGIREFVEKMEIRESRIKKTSFDIQNLFSDTVINAVASHDDIDHDRQRYKLGYELANLLALYSVAKKHRGILPKRFDKALLLFARSNMHLCNTSSELHDRVKRYLPRFWWGEKRVVSDIVRVFVEEDSLTQRVMERELTENDSREIRSRMLDYGKWRSKAFEYTRIIYPYLKQEHQWLNNGFSGKGEQSGGGSGTEQGGTGHSEGKESGQKDSHGDKSGDGDKKSEGGDYQEESGKGYKEVSEKDKGGKGEGKKKEENKPAIGIGSGKGIGIGTGEYSRRLPDFEKLDQLYTERAGRITLVSDSPRLQNLEVLKNREEADSIDTAIIDWPSTVMIRRPDGSPYLRLYQKKFPLEIDAAVPKAIGGLPDLCFVFDSSGSMSFDPYGGYGEYHIAVLTFYSILNGLEKSGIAPLLHFNAVNFSNSTFASGWRSYRDIRKVKEVLLDYQGGGTTIKVRKISDIREKRHDSYILFLLSDLWISNMGELEKELILTSQSRAAQVLVFKLGGRDISSERLEHNGMAVLYPQRIEDFMYESIKLTDEVYS